MKLLAINSSPKPTGQTAKLLELFVKRAKELGASVKTIQLYEEEIQPFSGELKKKAALTKLQKELLEADGFVIATPTYCSMHPEF